MKRIGLFLLISVLAITSVFAQDRNDRQGRRDSRELNNGWRDSKPVTVEGTLKLEKGLIVVANGENNYYVPMLARYIGFIDGLKEGAKVSVEGYEFRNFIFPIKANIAGKDYELLADGRRGPGFRNDNSGWGRGQGRGRGRGDFGRGRSWRGGSCCDWG